MTIRVNAEAPAAEAGTSRYARWVIALFFVALFIPGSFYVGVRMTPYRLYLIVMAVPMVLRYRSDPTLRITAVDALMFLAIFWRSLALVANHQTGEIMNAGALFIELFFGYMLGRVFIRSASDYRFFFKCFLLTLIAFLPFALLESVSHRRILQRIAGVVLAQPVEEISGPQIRFGLMRVQASFGHALLFGAFCSIAVANFYFIYRTPANLLFAGFAAFMTLLAISSSSILALGIQGGLIVYERALRPLRLKWLLLGLGALLVWFSFEAIFSMTIPEYFLAKLVLNRAGAEGRIDQIVYGFQEIRRSPVFGIGLDPAALPFWRGDVFDNFWLHTAVRFGVPSLLFIGSAFAVHFLRVALADRLTDDEVPLRRGYMIALTTTVLLIGTMTIWGIAIVFVMVYLGAGAWFYDRPRRARAEPARRPRPDRPGAGDPAHQSASA